MNPPGALIRDGEVVEAFDEGIDAHDAGIEVERGRLVARLAVLSSAEGNTFKARGAFAEFVEVWCDCHIGG